MTQVTGSRLTVAMTTFSLLTLRTSSMSFWSSVCTACASIRLRESVEGGGRRPLGEGKGEWIHSLHIYSSREEGMVEGTSMGGVLDGDLLMIPRLQ